VELKRRLEFLYFHQPSIGPEEKSEVLACLDSGWLTSGPRTKIFEEKFARYLGVPHAIGLNSCTAGLHLALVGAGIGPGDEVITSPITFVSTANVIVHTGARPVFADVDRRTGTLDPESLARAITPKTKAVITVHYAGHPCDMPSIVEVTRPGQITVIEDAAHAIEAEYANRRMGTWGQTAAFSFYATKNMTTGEGGMLVTRDGSLAERFRRLSLHGMDRDAWKRYSAEGSPHVTLDEPGFKYNMPDLQASIGIHQLDRLDGFWKRRRQMVLRMREVFSTLPAIGLLEDVGPVKNAHHLMPVLVTSRSPLSRDDAVQAYREWNIGTSIHFDCVHLQPYFRKRFGFKPGDCPVAEEIGKSVLTLPLYPRMTDEDVDYVIDVTRRIFS